MRAMAASVARPTTHSSLSPMQKQSQAIIWVALALVCLVYALPHLLSIAQTGKILPIFRIDDTIYMVRTAAAMRGDTLGNPYIAGHENAPKHTSVHPRATEHNRSASLTQFLWV